MRAGTTTPHGTGRQAEVSRRGERDGAESCYTAVRSLVTRRGALPPFEEPPGEGLRRQSRRSKRNTYRWQSGFARCPVNPTGSWVIGRGLGGPLRDLAQE